MKRLRIIIKNTTNPAYGGALVGAHAVAKQMAASLTHAAPSVPDDVEQQCALIDAAIADRVDAIVLLPAHATGVNAAIGRINAAGIPLVMMVSEPTAGDWVGYVGTDSEQMAFDLGERVLGRLPADAHIAIIDGHPGSITTPERRRGFEAAIGRHPGMRLVASASGDYQQAPARAAALGLLAAHRRIDAFLVANDLMAMGVLEALDACGRQAAVAGINGTPEAVAEVRRGRLVATASFDTHRFGCLAVEMALRHLRGEAVPRHIVLQADIIDSDNAAAWDRPYEARTRPGWDATSWKQKEKQKMKSPRIVSITKNASNPAYVGARCGMDRFARQRGVEVVHMTPVVDDSIAEQQAFLRSLRSDLPAALLISAAHHCDLDAELEALRDAGVVIVMFVGRTTRKDLAACFVGADDRAMTAAVAEAACQALGGQGTLVMVHGNPLGILYEARASGFRDGAASFPGIRVLGEKDGDFLRKPAADAMRALAESHGVPDAVLAANDFSAMGVLDALQPGGPRPVVGSVNATPDGVAAIRRGDMLVSAAFNAMAMGCIALEAALRKLRGEAIPSTILLPTELVTQANADAWDLPYEERPLPDWDEVLRGQEASQPDRAASTSIS